MLWFLLFLPCVHAIGKLSNQQILNLPNIKPNFALRSDGNMIAVIASDSSFVRTYTVAGSTFTLKQTLYISSHSCTVTFVDFSPSGEFLIFACAKTAFRYKKVNSDFYSGFLSFDSTTDMKLPFLTDDNFFYINNNGKVTLLDFSLFSAASEKTYDAEVIFGTKDNIGIMVQSSVKWYTLDSNGDIGSEIFSIAPQMKFFVNADAFLTASGVYIVAAELDLLRGVTEKCIYSATTSATQIFCMEAFDDHVITPDGWSIYGAGPSNILTHLKDGTLVQTLNQADLQNIHTIEADNNHVYVMIGSDLYTFERDTSACAKDFRVNHHQCEACVGGTNAAGDDPFGSDTTCDALPCGENYHVVNHICTQCPTGRTNPAGDDPLGIDTSCTAQPCIINQHVVNGVCTGCPSGKTNAPGDDPSGSDTFCDQHLCAKDFKVVDNKCQACPEGEIRPYGDDPSGKNTSCTAKAPRWLILTGLVVVALAILSLIIAYSSNV